MIKEAISKLTAGKSLYFREAKEVFEEIFNHKAAPSQIAAFLISLKMKGEAEDEILAAAEVIREKAVKINIKEGFLGVEDRNLTVMDTCGTGGSGLNKFNVSTAAAFVVAAAGIKVAKHGNRAMSSTCGSADVLEEMGINIGASISAMQEAIKNIGIGFLYAPLYHPVLKEVAAIRKEIGVRTIFNILGPLCNPAAATHQLLGVYSRDLAPVLVRVLKKLGLKRAMVVNGKDVADEISLTGLTHVSFLNNKKITNMLLSPSSFGLKKIKLKDLLVNGAKTSAKIIKDVFEGKTGAPRDIVLANSSACFYILGKVDNFKQGIRIAAELIDGKKVKEKYLEFKNFLENYPEKKNA